MKKIIACVLTVVLILGMFTGCGSSAADSETTQAPQQTGKLILATSADYPPFEFHILKDGVDTIVGIDVSVAQAIADKMGLELQIMDISFENILMAMQNGEADIAIAAMEQDAERDKACDFSDPYYTDYPPAILVKAEDAEAFQSMEDFSGKTVGAQNATTKADIVTEQMTGATLLGLAAVGDLVNSLVYDKCDALVLDAAVAEKYAETNSALVVLDTISLGEAAPYRIAVQEGDPKGLLPTINEVISQLIADNAIEQYITDAEALSDEAIATN